MPSFRAVIKYRKRYPHTSVLLQSIGSALGIKYDKFEVKNENNDSIRTDNINTIPGMNAIKVDSVQFKNDLDLINQKIEY